MRSDQRLTRGCRTRLQHSLCTPRSEQCWPTPRTHSHRHYRRAEGARWTLFRLDDSAVTELRASKLARSLPGNARDVLNILEGAIEKLNVRMGGIPSPSRDDLTTLMAEDFA